jgi:anthranilate/para-aminobenzoate synthase component II
MNILIIKNGTIKTEIDKYILNFDPTINIRIINSFDIISYEELIFDKIIILGGIQDLTNRCNKNYKHKYLNTLIDQVRIWIDKKIPILGICLGCQIIGESYNYKTKYHKNIFGNLEYIHKDNSENYFMNKFNESFLSIHSNYIDIDDKYVLTYAKSDFLIPYVIKIKNAIGVQFHPDLTNNVLKLFKQDYSLPKLIVNESLNMKFINEWLKKN